MDPQVVSYLAYFLGLVLFLRLRTPVLRSQWFFLLRSAFPNWKFYHAPGFIPHLYARAGHSANDGSTRWEPWLHFYPRRARQTSDLFHNPHTNLAHVRQSLVDHFHADLYDLAEDVDPRSLVSYRLVETWVRSTLRELHPDATCWQFELRMERTSVDGSVESDIMMTSPAESWP